MKKIIMILSLVLSFEFLCAQDASEIIKPLQSWEVKPVASFFREYRDKRTLILKTVEARTDLSLADKLKLYETEMNNLKEKYKIARRSEYENKSFDTSVANSCSSNSSGGVKKCGFTCVDAPSKNLYTKMDWSKVEGTNKGTDFRNDGSTACLNMTVAGKGVNRGILYSTFRYKPESITRLIDEELTQIFNDSE